MTRIERLIEVVVIALGAINAGLAIWLIFSF